MPLPLDFRELIVKLCLDVEGPQAPVFVLPLFVVRVAVLVVPFVPNVKLRSPLIGPHPLLDQSRVACQLPLSAASVMSSALAEGACGPAMMSASAEGIPIRASLRWCRMNIFASMIYGLGAIKCRNKTRLRGQR
jgi:hypothetical protein